MIKQTQRLRDLHDESMSQLADIQDAVYDDRLLAVGDRRFYSIAGAQWEGTLQKQFENRPRLEVNKIHMSIIRIFNEFRNNKIDVMFLPKNGDENQQMSDLLNGLFRADEQDSCADEAYDNAFEEGVGGGFGALRLRCDLEDEYNEDNEYQRIKIEPIFDADRSVFFDLGAKRQDKSDAKFCFEIFTIPAKNYCKTYSDDPKTWDMEYLKSKFKSVPVTSVPQSNASTLFFDYNSPDVIYLANKYVVEDEKIKISIFTSLDGAEEKIEDDDLDEEKLKFLSATGSVKTGERTIRKRRVRKYLMSGGGILEDYGYIAGKNIPIVPFYAKRWFIDNKERFMGHVRLARDPQVIKNVECSRLMEISSLSTIEKPIFDPEQINEYMVEWSDDNIVNRPLLRAKALRDMSGNVVATGPIGYTRVPNIPPAMGALLQLTDQDLKEILGAQESTEQVAENPSGKAVSLIQQRLDMQTYIYVSNFSKTKNRVGQVWLSMAQDAYVEQGRKMKLIQDSGKSSSAILNGKPMLDQNTGKIKNDNDLSDINFDVTVTVGPSSISKRMATVNALTNMMQYTQDPQTMQILTSMSMMNMEGEGIQEIRDYFRSQMVKSGVIKPSEEEAAEMQAAQQNQPPDPNSEYLKAAAEQALAEAGQARAKTVLTISQSKESESKTELNQAAAAEKMSGITLEQQKSHLDAAKIHVDNIKTLHDINKSTKIS